MQNKLHQTIPHVATQRSVVVDMSRCRGVSATAVWLLVLVGFACVAPAAMAQTLQWPVSSPQITQGYAAFNQTGNDQYHAGLDIISGIGDLTIRAAASGTIKTVPNNTYPNQNHGMGHTVIIEHPQLGLYTLYAHLASISVNNGQFVTAGTPIGVMGSSGGDFGIHLHFEMKHFGVLGNIHDTSVAGNQWGYTPTHPNLWGYANPWPYLDHNLNQLAQTAVTASTSQIVRTGPNSVDYTTVVTNISSGQQFAAFSEHNGWYQIFLPSTNGPASGWIQASPDGSAVLAEVNDPVQSHLGVNVRQDPTTSSPAVSKVWDRQWHVRSGQPTSGFGCGTSWHQIHLAANAPGSFGWVCGEFLNIYIGECSYALSLTSVWYPHTGGPGWFDVLTESGCQWSASSSASWVTITGGSSGSGDGTVSYSVSQNNTTEERTATITVEDEVHTITQEAAPCAYEVSPPSASFSAAGGSSSFNVETNGSNCMWSAVSSAGWITITSGASGTGDGIVNYSVAENNTAEPRTATITTEDQIHSISQDGAGLPLIGTSTTSINQSVTQGQNAAPQSFNIWNAGAGILEYTITVNAEWIAVDPSSGTSIDETNMHVVNYTSANLPTGTHGAAITIAAPDADNSPVVIPVELTVHPEPTDDWTWTILHPPGASFSMATGTTGDKQSIYAAFPGQGGRAGFTQGSADTYVSLHPTDAQFSSADGLVPGQQVGEVEINEVFQATLWSGSASSWVSLHPPGYSSSRAVSTSGNQQVGTVSPPEGPSWQAALWSGTASSFVPLHPTDAWGSLSEAHDTDGSQQVGSVRFGSPFNDFDFEAVVWTGSAESVVSLHPDGASSSVAFGIKDGQQVGRASFDGIHQAGTWSGSASSWTTLHPPGATFSVANATTGNYQAGHASFGNGVHAVVWNSTANGYVNLHDLLPAGDFASSEAYGIWDSNGMLTVAGLVETASGDFKAIMWTGPPPEPSLPGDLNGDGVVDSSDLLILLSEWGECEDPDDCPADINGDGVVDSSDLLILLSNWG